MTKEVEVNDRRRTYLDGPSGKFVDEGQDTTYTRAPASMVVEEKKETDEQLIAHYAFFKRMLNGHLIIHIDNFKYKGRIIIPEKLKHKPTKGIVVAIASGITDIVVGDRVVISQFAGYLLKFEGTPAARCISYSEVLGIVDQGAPEIEEEGA